MSDSQLTDLPKGRSRPFEIYVAVSAIAFLVSYVATYVYSFYLQKMGFDSQFHPGADFPGSLVDSSVHNPNKYNVGVHFFGDFWTTLLRSAKASPYLNIDDLGSSSYPPFAHFTLKPLAYLPYPIALTVYFTISVLLVGIAFWKSLASYSIGYRFVALSVAVYLSYPALFALDRGNNVLICAGLVCLSIHFYSTGQEIKSAILIGLAVALKIYPVFFIFIFINRRQWRNTSVSIATAVVSTLLSMLSFKGGLSANFKQLWLNLHNLSKTSGGFQLELNHSLGGLLAALKNSSIGPLSDLSDTVANHFVVVQFVLITVLGVLIFFRNSCDLLGIVSIASILNCLPIPLTYGYTLTLLLPQAIAMLYTKRDSKTHSGLAVTLGILSCSKGIPFGSGGSQLLNYVNPLVMTVSLILGTCLVISSGSPKRNHALIT